MRGRRLKGQALPGTKVMKETKATTAQKSSHQNMRFWRRRAIRTIVISPETRKKPKVESAMDDGRREQCEMGNETLTLEISQAGCHCGEGWARADRMGWGGGFARRASGNLYSGSSSPLRRLPNNKRSVLRLRRNEGEKTSIFNSQKLTPYGRQMQ